MKNLLKRSAYLCAWLTSFNLLGQGQVPIGGLGGADADRNPITVAVPFVSIAPDSRATAMGDVGVATSPDANSIHWNSGKLAFIEKDMGFSFSYSPWLSELVDDMSLNYLSFYKRIDKTQAYGFSLRYFDMGEIILTEAQNNEPVELGIENPNELAIDASYSRKLSEKMGLGVTGRFIWSNVAGELTGAPDARAGTSVAVDIGWYYRNPMVVAGRDSELSFGANLSNLGQKLSYSSERNENFIPANLRLGTAFQTNLDSYNSLTLAIDVNKLMVPTPPIYQRDNSGTIQTDPTTGDPIILSGKDPNRSFLSGTFGSFGDAPGGFSEEMKELMFGFGLEYWYRDLFAARAGYFLEHEDKGNRKYLTLGVGFRYQVLGFDFSYLVPSEQNHPLDDTLRLSLLFNFNAREDG